MEKTLKATTTFIEDVLAQMPALLEGYDGPFEFEVRTVEKPTETYTGMMIRKVTESDVGVCPVINLDRFYADFEQGCVEMDQIMKEIKEQYDYAYEHMPIHNSSDLSWILDYKQAKKKFILRASSANRKDFLDTVPHIFPIEGIALTVAVLAEQDGETGAAVISNQILEKYNVSKEQLFEDAFKSAPTVAPKRVENVKEMLIGLGCPEFMLPTEPIPMYIVTSESKFNGASVIFYPGVLEELYEMMGGPFMVLPSSVHEMTICPDEGREHDSFTSMVREINRTEVSSEDFLSDMSYYYDGKKLIANGLVVTD